MRAYVAFAHVFSVIPFKLGARVPSVMLFTEMPEMIPTLYASRTGVRMSLSILDVACRQWRQGMERDATSQKHSKNLGVFSSRFLESKAHS